MKKPIKNFMLITMGVCLFIVYSSNCQALDGFGKSFVTGKTLTQIEQTAAGAGNKVSGKIESLEPNSGALTLQMPTEPLKPKDKKFVKIFLNENTVIQDENKRIKLDDLNVGEEVKVVFTTTWLGKNTAQMIIVR